MIPAFGFSVGDFVQAINLIRIITKALKETGGASAEYQEAAIELHNLEHVLQHLEALQPTEENVGHVNAIRGMALACQLPLREFLKKLEAYELSLGPWRERTSFSSAGRKTRWAFSFGQEVEKLRARVAVKLISINLLLASHSLQTVSSIGTRVQRDHRDLLSMITEQRAALHKVHDIAEHVEDRLDNLESTTHVRLDAISSKSDATYNSMMSLRNLGEQIRTFIRTFPKDIRDLLRAILRADCRTYQAVLQIQERISRSPSSLHDSNIRFTNALGEYRELPYEYFCHWEPFEGFLRAQFKNKPGESKIIDGHFHILNVNQERQIVQKEHWNRAISQGATLTMSMIMSSLKRNHGCCPQPHCTGMGVMEVAASDQLTCRICHLRIFPTTNGLEDPFGHILISEEDIARQQAEEDLRLYGSRPEPPEAFEIQETSPSSNLSLKRNAPEPTTVVERPAKMLKKEGDRASNYDTVTAMDWNSGASPLDAWLNQSAIPSTAVAPESLYSGDSNKDLIAQELEEIKVFRNVHMATASEPQEADQAVDELEGLEIGAQIYYRNIRDRYPLLPIYLARRLAYANFRRYERLCSKGSMIEHSLNQAATVPQSISANPIDSGESAMAQEEYFCFSWAERRKTVLQELRKLEDAAFDQFPERRRNKEIQKIKKNERKLTELHSRCIRLRRKKSVRKIEGHTCTMAEDTGMHTPHDKTVPHESTSSLASTSSGASASPDDRWEYQCQITQKVQELQELQSDLEDDMKEYLWRQGGLALAEAACYALPSAKSTTQVIEELDFQVIKELEPREYMPPPPPPPRHISESATNIHEGTSRNNNKREAEATSSTYAPPDSDFWTCGTPWYSPASSLNSSLHGRPEYDPEEQNPNFSDMHSRHSSAKLDALPTLPPPPVKLGKDLVFDCDICGESIRVERRREWQRHVLRDLRPYLCIYQGCETADKTYTSRATFLYHECTSHEQEFTKVDIGPERKALTACAGTAKLKSDTPTQAYAMTCIFCGEVLSAMTRRERAEHLGRHMEEIAFSVVAKPYEDWEFYSDNSMKADSPTESL